MLTRADDLAKLTVLDETGEAIEVGSLWRDKTAVLVFVRHFGCIHCRAHVVELQRHAAAIRATGAEIHVIGSGTPNFIEGFREETRWEGPVYSDPTLAAYQAAELKRGVAATLDPRSLGRALSAFRGGQRQGRTQGDQWQQGGVVVIGAGGSRVHWQHASSRPGDNATGEQILAVLR